MNKLLVILVYLTLVLSGCNSSPNNAYKQCIKESNWDTEIVGESYIKVCKVITQQRGINNGSVD